MVVVYERIIAFLDGNGLDYAKLALAFMGATLGAYMQRTKGKFFDWLVAIIFGTVFAYLAGDPFARWLDDETLAYAAVFLLATIAREIVEVILSTMRYYIADPEKLLRLIFGRKRDK